MKDIFAAKSLEELKECGKLVEVREAYKAKAEPLGIKGKTNSWAAMYDSVKALAKLLSGAGAQPSRATIDAGYDDLYFKSEAAKLIYCLVELDGEIRMEKLGITKKLYTDKTLAAKWRNDVLKIVHPDNCQHPNAAKATEQVNYFYDRMTK